MSNENPKKNSVKEVTWEKVKKSESDASNKSNKNSEKKEAPDSKYKKIVSGLLAVIVLMLLAFLGSRYVLRKSETEVSVFHEIEDIADSVSSEEESLAAVPKIVNINTADKLELMQLKGIGEKKAEEIIKYRNSYGNFTSLEQLMDVNGIGEKMFNEIKDCIVIS